MLPGTRAGGMAATVVLAALVNIVCANDQSSTSRGGATQLSIKAEPSLFPDFDPQVVDYVTRCAGKPVEMTVVAPADTDVALDGRPPRSGSFTNHVRLQASQSFSFTRTPLAPAPFDIVHVNSVDVDADAVLISMRHTDGVYAIDRASGEILWRLGGTPTPESLTVVGDPGGANPFCGQHDARMHADGTLTAFDNGQTRDRPPRAIRVQIDADARTATYVGAISDPGVPGAVCCGSARRTASGGWLVGWGTGPELYPIIEYAADGSRTFKLSFPIGSSYRAHPMAAGQLSRAALRNGMEAQHPR